MLLHTISGYKIELTAEEQAFNHPGQEVVIPQSSAPTSFGTQASASSNGVGLSLGQVSNGNGTTGSQIPGTSSLGAPAGMGYGNGAPGYGYSNSGAPQTLGGAGSVPGQSQMLGQTGGVGSQGSNQSVVGVSGPPQQSAPGQAPGAPGAAPPAGQQQPGQMQQAHAIHYVTKIRNRFSTEPDTYR